MLRSISAALMAALFLSPSAHSQNGEDDDPRLAKLIATADPSMPDGGLVALDFLCQDDDAQFIETRLTSWLRGQGYKVETLAPYTLRVEIHPCEDVGLLPGRGGVREAYEGSSRPQEFQRAAPIWKVPFGKGSTAKYHVSTKMLMFKSGAQPVWSAHIKGQAGSFGVRRYKARLLDEMLNVFGENANEKILIEK